MAIVCGTCTSSLGRCMGTQIRHETIEEVRACYERKYTYEAMIEAYAQADEAEAKAERDAEIGYERWLETRDWAEQAAFEEYEARLGLMSYEEARDMYSGV